MFIPILIQILMFPVVNLTVQNEERREYYVTVNSDPVVHERCVQSGLVDELRISLKFCRKNSIWFGRCGLGRRFVNRISLDAISGGYTIEQDLLGDKLKSTKLLIDDQSDALTKWGSTQPFSIRDLLPDQVSSEDIEAVRLEVTQQCNRPSMLIEKLGSWISFGIFDTDRRSSGWIEFPLLKGH